MGGRRLVRDLTGDEAEDNGRKTTCLNEEDALQPLPKDLDPDNWPCYVLKGAIVYSNDGKRHANLLDAELDGPLVVRGRLEVDKDLHHLRKPSTPKGSEIEVLDVKSFSMGIGPITIWANGKTGWFEIRPASSYRRVYDKMVEGVTLYYFLTDIYESKKTISGEKTLQVDQIFDQYTKRIDRSTARPQVAQRCEEHATFLLSQMRKSSESIRWPGTSFYRWLIERCPQIYKRYLGKANAKEPPASAPAITIDLSSQESISLSEIRGSRNSRSFASTTATIIRTMTDLHNEGTIPRGRMTMERLTKVLYQRFNIASQSLANEILKLHAESLFKSLGNDWASTPIYSKLEAYISRPAHKESILRREAKTVLLQPRIGASEDPRSSDTAQTDDFKDLQPPRRRRKRSFEDDQDETQISRQDDPDSQVGNKVKKVVEKHRIIQPKTIDHRATRSQSLIAQAHTTQPGSQYNAASKLRISDEEDQYSTASTGRSLRQRKPRLSGKVAALRLAGSSGIQQDPTSPSNGEETQDGPSNKRPKVSHEPANDDSEEESSGDTSSYLEAEHFEEETMDVMEGLTLVSEPLPSASPQGPNGLWSCSRRDCEYYVCDADKPDGRAKVQAHFLEHADEIAKMENLVLEESRPYLPTSHLLEKLRTLGETARLSEERKIQGRVVPQAIKRVMI